MYVCIALEEYEAKPKVAGSLENYLNITQMRMRILFPCMHFRFGLEDLFMEYGVDLTIWAHEHSYERLWPLYNHVVYNGSVEEPYKNPKALTHVITGSAVCQSHYYH
jgi:hypothetical protein